MNEAAAVLREIPLRETENRSREDPSWVSCLTYRGEPLDLFTVRLISRSLTRSDVKSCEASISTPFPFAVYSGAEVLRKVLELWPRLTVLGYI